MENKDRLEKQSQSNLRRGNPAWHKGVSGNPKGRKRKEDCLLSCIKTELAAKSDLQPALTREQLIAGILVDKAVKGNMDAIKLLLEYTAMKPAQAIELGAGDTGPVELVVRYATNSQPAAAP